MSERTSRARHALVALAWSGIARLDARVRRVEDTEPQDVFLVSFPRSGNTWLRLLVAGLLYEPDLASAGFRSLLRRVPDLHGHSHYLRRAPWMVFKSHHLPRPWQRRVIHLVRDGRDAIVSYAHYLRALHREAPALEALVERPPGVACGWAEHVERWLENPYGAELMLLRYEDLRTRPVEELARVCSFLGVERDARTRARVVEQAAFGRLREKEEREGWGHARWPREARFFRRGRVGSHRDEMPAAVRSAFEARAGATLRRLGYAGAARSRESRTPAAARSGRRSATEATKRSQVSSRAA